LVFRQTGSFREGTAKHGSIIEKTRRESNRCLKRYLTRSLYRLLEQGAPLAT
jgi:hypothetical protein